MGTVSRHQPLNGADSPEVERRPYIVDLRGRYDEDDRLTVRVPSAFGPRDAFNQAQLDNPGYSAVAAREVAAQCDLCPAGIPHVCPDHGGKFTVVLTGRRL
jgi:hypothetical protein